MSIAKGFYQAIGSRRRQEDWVLEAQLSGGYVAVLSDGMGGCDDGDKASQTIAVSFIDFIKKQEKFYQLEADLLLDAVYFANAQIAEFKLVNYSNMGATLVALLIKENHAWWVSVGDSLLYLWRNGSLHKLNAEHSHAHDLHQSVFLSQISSVEAINNPDRNKLTSALTGDFLKFVDVSRFGIELHDNDTFLLASDGLETINLDQVISVLGRSSTPEIAASVMIEQVLKAGNPQQDNVSICIIQYKPQYNQKNIKVNAQFVKADNFFLKKLLLTLGTVIGLGLLGIGLQVYINTPILKKPPDNINACSNALDKCVTSDEIDSTLTTPIKLNSVDVGSDLSKNKDLISKSTTQGGDFNAGKGENIVSSKDISDVSKDTKSKLTAKNNNRQDSATSNLPNNENTTIVNDLEEKNRDGNNFLENSSKLNSDKSNLKPEFNSIPLKELSERSNNNSNFKPQSTNNVHSKKDEESKKNKKINEEKSNTKNYNENKSNGNLYPNSVKEPNESPTEIFRMPLNQREILLPESRPDSVAHQFNSIVIQRSNQDIDIRTTAERRSSGNMELDK